MMTRRQPKITRRKRMMHSSTSDLNSDKKQTNNHNPYKRLFTLVWIINHIRRMNQMSTSCPNCGSQNVRLKPIATRACGGIGAVTGGIAAAKGGATGAAIGTAICPGVGTAIGGIAGIVGGFLTGALSGAAVGRAIDRKIVQSFHCNQCGCDFAA